LEQSNKVQVGLSPFDVLALEALIDGRPERNSETFTRMALATGANVLQRCHLLEHAYILEEAANTEAGNAMRRETIQGAATEEDLARVRRKRTTYQVEERGLSSPVRSDHARDSALLEAEVDVVHSEDAPEVLRHIDQFEFGWGIN
jgi:hypothetical protein